MEANELRIGNIIDRNGEPVVLEIKDLVWLNKNSQEFNSCHSYARLTQEWLLKFGLEKVQGSQDYEINIYLNNEGEFKDREECVVYIHWLEDENYYVVGLWSRNTPHEDGAWTTTENKYVHQLQNLFFALTGIELTIKEFSDKQ